MYQRRGSDPLDRPVPEASQISARSVRAIARSRHVPQLVRTDPGARRDGLLSGARSGGGRAVRGSSGRRGTRRPRSAARAHGRARPAGERPPSAPASRAPTTRPRSSRPPRARRPRSWPARRGGRRPRRRRPATAPARRRRRVRHGRAPADDGIGPDPLEIAQRPHPPSATRTSAVARPPRSASSVDVRIAWSKRPTASSRSPRRSASNSPVTSSSSSSGCSPRSSASRSASARISAEQRPPLLALRSVPAQVRPASRSSTSSRCGPRARGAALDVAPAR